MGFDGFYSAQGKPAGGGTTPAASFGVEESSVYTGADNKITHTFTITGGWLAASGDVTHIWVQINRAGAATFAATFAGNTITDLETDLTGVIDNNGDQYDLDVWIFYVSDTDVHIGWRCSGFNEIACGIAEMGSIDNTSDQDFVLTFGDADIEYRALMMERYTQ